MIDAPLGYALTIGVVTAFNPCGLPMLPAYLSYFLGIDDPGETDPRAGLATALRVGGAVSAGFVATFAVLGLVIAHVTRSVQSWIPWLTVVIGLGLVALGVALIAGFQPTFALPKLDRGGRSRRVGSMALFGVSYAVASLGCTIQLFLALIALGFSERSLTAALATFLAFAAGMSLVVLALTVALALARHSLVRAARRALPYVQRAAGVLLVPIGAYVAWYGWSERSLEARVRSDRVIDRVTGWSTTIQGWIDDAGGTRVALALAVVVTLAAGTALARRVATRGPSHLHRTPAGSQLRDAPGGRPDD